MYGVSTYWDRTTSWACGGTTPRWGFRGRPRPPSGLASGRDAGFPTLAEAGERLAWQRLGALAANQPGEAST